MKRIQAPDGSILEFPPEMDDDAILGVMRKEYGGPQEDNRPWYAKLGSAADDMVRIGANAATFGYADKLAGYLGGEGTEAERAKTQGARDRAGSAAYAADIGGGLATGMGLANSGVTAMRFVPQGMKGLSGLGARTGAMAVDGAAYGALSATGNDTDVTEGALLGGAAGALGNVGGEAIARGVGKVAGAFNKQPKVPSVDEIRAAKDAAYKASEDAGVILSPNVARGIRSKIEEDLANFAYIPENEPKIAPLLKMLQRAEEGNTTLKGLDAIRKGAGNVFNPMEKAQSAMASKMTRRIDEALNELTPNDVVAGDAKRGVESILEARRLNTQTSKYDKIAEALAKAENNAAAAGTGGNIDNAIRQQIKAIKNSPSKRRGFSPDELAAMDEIIKGVPSQNAARLIGRLSPQGNGLMMALHAASATSNPAVSLPIAGVGAVAKTLADRATPQNAEALLKIIAAGGKKSDAFAPPNAVQRLAESKREALIRAILGGSIPTLTGAE